jgi:hypothetical protein
MPSFFSDLGELLYLTNAAGRGVRSGVVEISRPPHATTDELTGPTEHSPTSPTFSLPAGATETPARIRWRAMPLLFAPLAEAILEPTALFTVIFSREMATEAQAQGDIARTMQMGMQAASDMLSSRYSVLLQADVLVLPTPAQAVTTTENTVGFNSALERVEAQVGSALFRAAQGQALAVVAKPGSRGVADSLASLADAADGPLLSLLVPVSLKGTAAADLGVSLVIIFGFSCVDESSNHRESAAWKHWPSGAGRAGRSRAGNMRFASPPPPPGVSARQEGASQQPWPQRLGAAALDTASGVSCAIWESQHFLCPQSGLAGSVRRELHRSFFNIPVLFPGLGRALGTFLAAHLHRDLDPYWQHQHAVSRYMQQQQEQEQDEGSGCLDCVSSTVHALIDSCLDSAAEYPPAPVVPLLPGPHAVPKTQVQAQARARAQMGPPAQVDVSALLSTVCLELGATWAALLLPGGGTSGVVDGSSDGTYGSGNHPKLLLVAGSGSSLVWELADVGVAERDLSSASNSPDGVLARAAHTAFQACVSDPGSVWAGDGWRLGLPGPRCASQVFEDFGADRSGQRGTNQASAALIAFALSCTLPKQVTQLGSNSPRPHSNPGTSPHLFRSLVRSHFLSLSLSFSVYLSIYLFLK